MSRPSPRRLLHFVTRRLRLRKYLQDPGDGRRQPQIPAKLLLWALLVGQVLRQNSFHAVEALVRSPARRNLPISASFSDDALGYFTERLDPDTTRQALLSVVRRAKRNKATSAVYFVTAPSRFALKRNHLSHHEIGLQTVTGWRVSV